MAESINSTPLSEEERKGLIKKVEIDMELEGLPTTNEGYEEERFRFDGALDRMVDLAFRMGYLTALRKVDGSSQNPLREEVRLVLRSISRMSDRDLGLDRPAEDQERPIKGGHNE